MHMHAQLTHATQSSSRSRVDWPVHASGAGASSPLAGETTNCAARTAIATRAGRGIHGRRLSVLRTGIIAIG